MKFLVAAILVVVTVVTAESPNQSPAFQRQTSKAYQPRGWKPSGPSFSATFQRQEQAPPVPAPSYGPPPAPSASYGPPPTEPTTTELPTTTEGDIEVTTTLEPQAESLQVASLNQKIKSEKLEKEPLSKPGPVFVLLPQGQSLIYAASPSGSKADLAEENTPKDVEIIKDGPKLAPIQAIPALAKIQAPVILAKYEQVPQQLVQLERIQVVPVSRYASSLSQTSVYTPYSASYVQVFQ